MSDNLENIVLKGVRVNNLKNISLTIPHEKLVVITGVSGSGKSSLAFDTLYAEGQRRYVESLSSYARQFLGRLDKPEVDFIDGIPPAMAIQQNKLSSNPRSTVGTVTEIYDYLKLLFARIGKTYSPISNTLVKKHSINDVVEFITSLEEGTKVIICFEYKLNSKKSIANHLDFLTKQSYTRVLIDNEIKKIEDLINSGNFKSKTVDIVVDRVKSRDDSDLKNRLADSVQTAFFEGHGDCCVTYYKNDKAFKKKFSNRFEADNMLLEEPTPHLFSFNNPIGACPQCEGYGKILGIDADLVIPNKSLSIYDEAVVCWKGEKMQKWLKQFITKSQKYSFPIHRPYFKLTDDEKDLLWNGKYDLNGINDFFNFIESKKHKIQYRIMLSRYRGKTTCPECKGKRLKKEAFYVKINKKSIGDLIDISIINLKTFFDKIKLSKHDSTIAERLLNEIKLRLQAMLDVGLGYLTLNRLSQELSGGESQRIRLASLFGSGLAGSLYILDEPSIGLHPRDTEQLIKILKDLKNKGNTVVVVEHDEDIIKSADYVIDIGPGAGDFGGEVIFTGKLDSLKKNTKSLTAKYLNGTIQNIRNINPDKWRNFIKISGARHNNLKNIDVKVPLGIFTAITGVSGSGKSSLIKGIFYPAIKKYLNEYGEKTGDYTDIDGDLHLVNSIQYVDQKPIGKSSRSNPATYIKAYDEIRKLFSSQKRAKTNGLKPSHFSFNVDGGRCDACKGEGEIKVEMQFMADVYLTCDVCNGKRFKDEILEVKYQEKNVYDILEMQISEAVNFFGQEKGNTEQKIARLLKYYVDVGLDYVKTGQSSNTLSGGESQRIKLANFLSQENAKPGIFIFDEPTVGLHFNDISKLLQSFKKIQQKGHTLIVIEHNPEVIRFADWVIDLGPDGGDNGGNIVFEGTVTDLMKCGKSFTGRYLNDEWAFASLT